MKKGFTLIELLAVIVILAILALIVSPIISRVISDAKKASAERSAEGYIKAVEYAQVQYQYKNGGSITTDINKLTISAQGIDKVTVNSIEFNTSGIVISATISIDGYICKYVFDKTECEVPRPPNEKLINELYKDKENSGLVEDSYEEGRYYFRGADPKNKLILQENISGTITDVDYRIISFEADGTIKVVREERIDANGINWDIKANRLTTENSYCTNSSNYGCNAWANQSNTYRSGVLMDTYFSLKYYANNTATEMSTQGIETGTKTTVIKDSSLNEYLNGMYLTTYLAPISNYIDYHMWDVGGIKSLDGKSFKNEIKETKTNQWKGYIALPSIIDYKNASDNITQCINIYSSTIIISGTSYYPCTKSSDGNINNYLYKSGYYQWSLSAHTNGRNDAYIYNYGNFHYTSTNNVYGARPSFYLKSTIKLSGEGTEGNEFKIAES